VVLGDADCRRAVDEDGADAAIGTGNDHYPILFHVYSFAWASRRVSAMTGMVRR
jgi:hypothetical protein